MLRLDVNFFDYVILAIYFALVVTIGVLARRAIATSEDFLLSGRSLPAWVTGLAFISANLGAIEILGMAANGAQYGISTVHFYWVGAVPAMVFLGIVMMPFYYGSKVRSVPEFLLRRFNRTTHLFNALSFALAAVLIAGVNLFALALVINALIGWPIWLSIVISAAFVLAYITLGGLSGAIYNEVLQFFVIIAGLVPLVIIGLKDVGGWDGLQARIKQPEFFNSWSGTHVGTWSNPLGDWIGIIMGLGFVLSFGYWTTNFAEVQRALSAKDLSAAQRTPLIGSFPKIFIPALTVIPGLIAVAVLKDFKSPSADYNNAIPELMGKYLPNGTLGVALAGLLAAFMAGMAANVSSFNTVFTYDIWQTYIVKGRRDGYYLNVGRVVTVVGIAIGIGTAFIAQGYTNIMNYIQLLFGFFNAPLFATFIIAMFWKRASPWAGVSGLAAGALGRRGHALRELRHRVLLPRRPRHVALGHQRADGELLRRDRRLRRRCRGDRHGQPRDETEAARGAGRSRVGHSRPGRPRPGVDTQTEVVGLAQGARRGLARHHRRPVRALRLGGEQNE